MGEERAFENGRISDFQWLMTLNLTLDRVIVHTVTHQSTVIDLYLHINFIEIEETFLDDYLLPTSKSRDTKKLGQKSKIRPNKL